MCDYSLGALRTRLAVEGEALITYRFPTGSLGLTSPAELETHKKKFRGWRTWLGPREVPRAVCIPPGARLLLRDIPKRIQRQLAVGATEEVVFIQTSDEEWRHLGQFNRFSSNSPLDFSPPPALRICTRSKPTTAMPTRLSSL
jgi:hypothetical protein